MALMQMEFKSETLKRTVSMNVILPIERFRGPFPTLYLLHGPTAGSATAGSVCGRRKAGLRWLCPPVKTPFTWIFS